MIGMWMLYAVGVAVALGAGAMAAERVLQLFGLPRRGAWAASIAGSMALPITLPVWWARSQGSEAASPGAFQPLDATEILPVVPRLAIPASEDVAWGVLLDRALGFGWMAASGVCLLLLIASTISLHRMRREWRQAKVAGSRVLVSGRTGPAVVGCFRPAIVLPEWVLQWEAAWQRMIVEHEREHTLARDPLLMMLAWCALMLTPWNLPLWWQAHRLRLAVEMDCDRRVLRRVRDVHGYGVLLLEVSRRAGHRWLPMAAFSEPASLLERRIRGMTAVRSRFWVVQVIALTGMVCSVPVAVATLPAAESPWVQRALSLERLSGGGENNPQPESGPGPAVFSGLELEWPIEVPPGRWNQSSPTTPQDTSRVYEPQQLDRRPRLNNAATVAEVMERLYPRELREAGIGGTVIVEFTIERDGIVNPASVSVVESPRDELSQVTLQALERFRFSPGQIDGVNVRVRIGMPINWRSSAPETPPAQGIGADRASPLRVVPAEIFQGPPGHIVLALPEVRAGGTAAETTLASADELGALSRAPRLSNEAEVRQDMSQLYPAELQASGVGGTVIAQFVIGADGRTEPGSITIIHSANPAFNDATRTVVQRMRFIPAQFQARDAPVMTQMAITWEP